MGSNNNSNSNCDIVDDKLTKKAFLLETIAERCASSSNELLQKIGRAIDASGDDSKLDAAILSGGYTNYSYKVFVDEHPELCVFAKLSFEYALWNPDRTSHYDLQRTQNEYEIMNTLASKAPDCVVAPLACWNVERGGQRMKLLLTEWSRADEQICNQFIDGAVDPRIAPKVADTLSTLHRIEDFDEGFNELVRPCTENILAQMKSAALEASAATMPRDRTEAYCASLGQDVVLSIIEANVADYRRRDCLIHSDSHAMNILVESKPPVGKSGNFGPNGMMVICDWEMAMAGPMGRDIGLALSMPVSYLVYHALNGHLDANESIKSYINTLIDTYCSKMTEAVKTPEDMAALLRSIFGWCGWFQYLAHYVLQIMDSYPMESEEKKDRLRDALGVVGLKLMRLSYDCDHVPASTEAEEIRNMFNAVWQEEVTSAFEAFTSSGRKMLARKDSSLRASGRRLSDTEMLYAATDSVRRLSSAGDIRISGEKRVSIDESVICMEPSQ